MSAYRTRRAARPLAALLLGASALALGMAAPLAADAQVDTFPSDVLMLVTDVETPLSDVLT